MIDETNVYNRIFQAMTTALDKARKETNYVNVQFLNGQARGLEYALSILKEEMSTKAKVSNKGQI